MIFCEVIINLKVVRALTILVVLVIPIYRVNAEYPVLLAVHYKY